MLIKKIYIEGVRNLQPTTLELHRDLNVFIGANGSGKTSLLEGIYLLSLGRSFRTAKVNSIINLHNQFMRVVAVYSNKLSTQLLKISVFKAQQQDKINKIGETIAGVAEIAAMTPTQLINDETTDLVFKHADLRRRFIDWLAFYASKNYQLEWREFNKILLQRNKLLKKLQVVKDTNLWQELSNINVVFVKIASKITATRKLIWHKFIQVWEQVITELDLSAQFLIEIKFFKGWTGNLAEQLDDNQNLDCKYGTTQLGPHKADLKFMVNKRSIAKEVLSRGQGKLLALTMILARSKFIKQCNQNIDFVSVLLIDDLCAELDDHNIIKVTKELCRLNQDLQILITGTDQAKLAKLLPRDHGKWFCVHDGIITEEHVLEPTPQVAEECST